MLNFIIIYLYNFIFILLLPVILLRFLFKSLKLKAYRQRFKERLGIFNIPKNFNSKSNIWIHAVSVGEIIASISIIKKIKEQLPESNIVLTCTTPRGSEIIQQKLKDLVTHIYFPLDISFAIKNFLIQFKPNLLILMEKELWPNLIWHCNKNKIPIIIANAQLSNKSFKRYLLFKSLITSLLSKISKICAQTKFDAYKFKKLISKKNHNNIIITGNIKFDNIFDNIMKLGSQSNNQQGNNQLENIAIIKNLNIPIWVAASTHAIEEDYILAAHKLILNKLPNAVLILVPRHPERVNLIIKTILKFNLTYQIHSRSSIFIKPIFNAQVYLVDSIGELNKFYQISQISFVGGSLVPNIGGHNVLEPAALGVPIIVGPYTNNCQEIVSKLKFCDGLKVAINYQQLAEQILIWFGDDNLRVITGDSARKYLIQGCGVVDKIFKVVVDCLNSV